MDALVTVFAAIGVLTTVVVVALFGYYLVTRRPTPDATVREAVTSIEWFHAVGLFILPPTLAGVLDGAPVLGFAIGFGFVVFLVGLQWWNGPV